VARGIIVPVMTPIAGGVLYALAAALMFGATTPVIAWAGGQVGPLTTAALLYLGAATAAGVMRVRSRSTGASLRRSDLLRLLAVAVTGAAVAPALFAWGVTQAGATAGSLVLNLEAVFTVMLAWMIYREPLGRRVIVAVLVMAAGGAMLVVDAGDAASAGWLGAMAVAGATLAWAMDNTLTRGLAEHEPLQVVAAKGALGALLTGTVAVLRGEALPAAGPLLALLACGATGYGVSLRLYLLAQRRIGAARTGSVFALAPFVGAAIAWSLGDRSAGLWTVAAAACFVVGVVLHVSEAHEHEHLHEPVEHEHAHRHDDGHHEGHHDHEPAQVVVGEHTHRHRHSRLEHRHCHAPDLHHGHSH
jgi:drug/metabolite transporter (DMT)-like permease